MAAAPRRMRIKPMANIRRERPGLQPDSEEILPNSSCPGSPGIIAQGNSPPSSPAPVPVSVSVSLGNMSRTEARARGKIEEDSRSSCPDFSSVSEYSPQSPTKTAKRTKKNSGVSDLEQVSSPARQRRISSPARRPEQSKSPVKSSNASKSPQRPSPSNSPFKTITMIQCQLDPRGRTPSALLSPGKVQIVDDLPRQRVDIHHPVASRSTIPPQTLRFQQQQPQRRTPSPVNPKSPLMLDQYYRGMRPDSPLRSPTRNCKRILFAESAFGRTTAAFSPTSSCDLDLSDGSRRADSPAASSFGIHSGLTNKDFISGNLANMINSTDTLRQRLQKGTNLNTSKYATTRKEFLLKYMDKKPEAKELTILHYTFYNPPGEKKEKKKTDDMGDIFVGNNSEFDNPFDGGGVAYKDLSTDLAVENRKEPVVEKTPTVGPRVKVGANGELIIDEQSLVVETSESQRAKKHLEEMETVSGAGFEVGSSGLYRHKPIAKRGGDWTSKETVKFYRALSMCGSDFSMMMHMFPNRSRAELKSKFKREDRRNPSQVNEALACQTFDPLDKFTSSEDEGKDLCISAPTPKKNRKRSIHSKSNQDNQEHAALTLLALGTIHDESHARHNVQVGSEHQDSSDIPPVKPKEGKQHIKTSLPPKKPQNDLTNHSYLMEFYPHLFRQETHSGEIINRELPCEDFVFNNETVRLTIPAELRLKTNQVPPLPARPQVEVVTAQYPQPVYGSSSTPKLKVGRPRRIFDKNIPPLRKPRQLAKPEPKQSTVSSSSHQEKQQSKPKRVPKKKNTCPANPAAEMPEMPIDIEPEVIRPDILKFDPNDPLGIKIIKSLAKTSADRATEVILDAPNYGTIPHQVFDIQPIISPALSSSTPPDSSNIQIVASKSVNCGSSDMVDRNPKVTNRSPKRPPPQRFRCPGPGRKANLKSSSLVDEIEIEIISN